MHFAATISYPADVETVAAMLASEEFVGRKMAAAGAQESTVEIFREDRAFTVTTRAKMPTTEVPTAFRSLVGDSLDVRLVEAWGAPQRDGSRSSTLALDILGVPVRIAGGQRLEPTETGCTESYDGEVTAKIPIFGRPVEQAAVETVKKVVDVERRLGLEHLAGS